MNDQLHYVLGLHGDPWAIEPMRMRNYLQTLIPGLDHDKLEDRCCPRKIEYYSWEGEVLEATAKPLQQAIAVLPLVGPITNRASAFTAFFGGTSVQKWRRALDEMVASSGVGSIVLDVDSPGGSVGGIAELAGAIRSARSKKRIVAVANTWAASAAYHLASQADQLFVTPSGEVGSIGVYSLHMDWSKALQAEGIKPTFAFAGEHKVEANPFEPLTEEGLAEMQAAVDYYYDLFVNDVGKGRQTTPARVKADYGKGRMLRPTKALEVGAVDGIRTFEQVLRGEGLWLAEQRRIAADRNERHAELDRLEHEVLTQGIGIL